MNDEKMRKMTEGREKWQEKMQKQQQQRIEASIKRWSFAHKDAETQTVENIDDESKYENSRRKMIAEAAMKELGTFLTDEEIFVKSD